MAYRKDLERSALMMGKIKSPFENGDELKKMTPLPAKELSYKGFDVTKGVNKKDRAKAKDLMSASDLQKYENKTDMSQISNNKNRLPGNTTLSSMSNIKGQMKYSGLKPNTNPFDRAESLKKSGKIFDQGF
jgi:hypothetical protein